MTNHDDPHGWDELPSDEARREAMTAHRIGQFWDACIAEGQPEKPAEAQAEPQPAPKSKPPAEVAFNSLSDVRLAAKAIRERWPMKPADRDAAIECLRRTIADPATRPALLSIAKNSLASIGITP